MVYPNSGKEILTAMAAITIATLQAHCPAIHCEGCANSIKRSLGKLPGVREVTVDIHGKNVAVKYDNSLVEAATIRARLEAAGFPTD